MKLKDKIDFGGAVGGGQLVDKFGHGYSFSGVNVGFGIPLSLKVMDGYVYPPSLGNNELDLEGVIGGYGYSFEADSILSGSGTSYPVPEGGRSIGWITRSISPLGAGVSIGFTERRPDLDTYGWDMLDEPVPNGEVARLPDNGCCGQ
jgi:hypothetical protein